MIATASISEYNIRDIKKSLDIKISELSNDGIYDYISTPSYNISSPSTTNVFWAKDTMLIKWSYTEPLIHLIPYINIYLVNDKEKILLFENIPTQNKAISWMIPDNMDTKLYYTIVIESIIDSEIISYTSTKFKFSTKSISIANENITTPIPIGVDEEYNIKWIETGSSNVYKIELVHPKHNGFNENYNPNVYRQSHVTVNNIIGDLIVDTDTDDEYIMNKFELNYVPVISVLEDKYITSDAKYTWIANDVPKAFNRVRIKVSDYNSSAYSISDDIPVSIPYILFRSNVGIKMTSVTSGSTANTGSSSGSSDGDIIKTEGQGNSQVNIYNINPSDLYVNKGGNLTFEYTSQNCNKIYITTIGDDSYSENIPTEGKYKIENIQVDTTYLIHSVDFDGLTKIAPLAVLVKLDESHIVDDIKTYSLSELIKYSFVLIDSSLNEILIPEDIKSKIALYRSEMTVKGDSSKKYLLKSINSDVLIPIISIFNTTTTLKNKVVELSAVINGIDNTAPLNSYKISGTILDTSNRPVISDIILNDGSRFQTNVSGSYEISLSTTYSGSIVPVLSGYIFEPSFRSYNNITNDISGENYICKFDVKSQPDTYINISSNFITKYENGSDPYIVISQQNKPNSDIKILGNYNNNFAILRDSPLTFDIYVDIKGINKFKLIDTFDGKVLIDSSVKDISHTLQVRTFTGPLDLVVEYSGSGLIL